MIYLINMQIYIKKNIFHSQNDISNKIAIIPNNLRRNNHRRSFFIEIKLNKTNTIRHRIK